MANTREKWQEIANRGLQDKFDPQTRSKFDEAVNRGLITLPQQQLQPALRPEQAATPISEDFIPTEEALAIPAPGAPERTLGEQVIGAGEAALTTATGITGGALGFGAGSLSGALGELTGRLKPGEGLEEAQALAAKLTFVPRTEAGQEFVGDIGEALSTLPPVGLTNGIIPKIAVPNIRLPKSTNKAINAISEAGPENLQKSFTKKLGDDRFEPRIFGLVKEARKQGFDDSVTTLIANAGPRTKRRMLKQVLTVEKGKGDTRAKALLRTADEAGEAVIKQFDFVKRSNEQAETQLGRVTKGLKGKSADVSEPINSFFKRLENLGVKFDEDGKPNFETAVFEGSTPAESLVNKIALRIKRNKGFDDTDGFKAHEFKKFIDENVNFEKSEGGLSGRVDRAVKSLRSDINESINNISDRYKQANKQFSDTITTLNEMQKVAGRNLDFSGPNVNKAVGTLLRRQTGNDKSRANLLTAIDNLEKTTRKYGGSFDDDILSLSIFADELDAVFGSGARTSLRGEVGKAGVDAAIDISQMTLTGAAAVGAKALNRKRLGINEKNQLKAIKDLLKSKNN
jgi:chaperonin cofactor prefoldin